MRVAGVLSVPDIGDDSPRSSGRGPTIAAVGRELQIDEGVRVAIDGGGVERRGRDRISQTAVTEVASLHLGQSRYGKIDDIDLLDRIKRRTGRGTLVGWPVYAAMATTSHWILYA